LSRDLRPLFDPRSIAILGASNDPAKWGNRLALGALRSEGSRSVYLVNRNGGDILERPAYPSLADLPEAPELVVLSVPAEGFEEAVEASLAAGARALVGITTGLGETGADGRARETAIVERVRAAGAVLLGPNCLGIFDAATGLDLGWSELQGGSVGLVSQSGNLALELAYVDLGKAGYSGTFFGTPVTGGTVKVSGFNTSLVGLYPATDKLELFAKAGLYAWEAKASDVTGGVPFSDKANGSNLSLGIGANYYFTKNVGARLEWENFELDPGSAGMISAGIIVKF